MREVKAEFLDEAVHILRSVVEEIDEWHQTKKLLEIYPQIVVCPDSSYGGYSICGAGVALIAFFIQEGRTQLRQSQCIKCKDNHFDCGAYCGGVGIEVANDKGNRTMLLDFLGFLKGKYPDLYIPNYRTADTGLDLADLFAYLADSGDVPNIGVVLPKNDCSRFRSKEK